MATLILTLQLDPHAHAFFEALRQLHFPPERNLVPAHLTLFHRLPHNTTVTDTLKRVADKEPRFSLKIAGLRSLGRGVAYELSSPALLALHATLALAFAAHLIAQDTQPFKPHVVIQNKVSPEQARALLMGQQQAALPQTVHACGLDLWEYLDGPWRKLDSYPFAGN